MKNTAVRSLNRIREMFSGKTIVTEEGTVINGPQDADIIKGSYTIDELRLLSNNIKNKGTSDSSTTEIDSFLRTIHANSADIMRKNKNVCGLIPELTPIKSIWKSSLLAPTDLQTNSLSFTLPIDYIDDDVKKSILNLYDKVFCDELKFNDMLSKCVDACLFEGGSYPVLVLPNHNIDLLKYILDIRDVNKGNIAVESLSPEKRILLADNSVKPIDKIIQLNKDVRQEFIISTESINTIHKSDKFDLDTKLYFDELSLNLFNGEQSTEAIKIVDKAKAWVSEKFDRQIIVGTNPGVINNRSTTINNVINDMVEKLGCKDEKKAVDTLNDTFNNAYSNNTFFTTMNIDDTILNNKNEIPLNITIPAQCVIPVCQPGGVDEHIGYFVLVDEWCTPMSKSVMSKYDAAFSNNLVDLSAQAVYGTTDSRTGGNGQINALQKYNAAVAVFDLTLSKLLEDKLDSAGLKGVSIGRYQTISKCIFHSLLQKNKVGLIFVPKQLLQYYAVAFREDGTGKSMLEDMEFTLSMRSTFLVTQLLALIRSAIEKTTIEIDMTNNLQPHATFNLLKEVYYQKNKLDWTIDPDLIVRNLYDSRISFKPKGLKGLGDYNISTQTEGTQTVKVDNELLDYLNKSVITGFRVPQAAVQETENVDYATSVASKNLFFANDVNTTQQLLMTTNKEHIRTYVLYCPTMLNKIKDILNEKYVVSNNVPTDQLQSDIAWNEEKKTDPNDEPTKDDSSEQQPDDKEGGENDTEDASTETTDVEKTTQEKEEESVQYTKDIPVDFNQEKGQTLSSSKQKLTSEELHRLVLRIVNNVTPMLPKTNLSKGKAQYAEIQEFAAAAGEIMNTIFPDDMIPIDDQNIKNYYKSCKLKVQSKLVRNFISLVGKTDLFDIPEIDADFELHDSFKEMVQILLAGSNGLRAKFKVLNPIPADDPGY